MPGICALRGSGLVGRRISGPFCRCAVNIRLLEQLKSQWLCWGPDSDGDRLRLGQVHGEVVSGPAVPGPEGLGLCGLRVTHDAGFQGAYAGMSNTRTVRVSSLLGSSR